VPILEHGNKVWKEIAEVDTADCGAHANWPDGFFATIIDEFLYSTSNLGGLVGGAKSCLIDARALLELAESIMRSVATEAKTLRST
jgi:hypothetical protein